MGKQELSKDRVTSLLQLDEWEDDQTATTVAMTVRDSNSEEEDDDNLEEAFEEEQVQGAPNGANVQWPRYVKCTCSCAWSVCARGHKGT